MENNVNENSESGGFGMTQEEVKNYQVRNFFSVFSRDSGNRIPLLCGVRNGECPFGAKRSFEILNFFLHIFEKAGIRYRFFFVLGFTGVSPRKSSVIPRESKIPITRFSIEVF